MLAEGRQAHHYGMDEYVAIPVPAGREAGQDI